MRIVIMGCGRAGSTLAERLAADHHVAVIEPDRANLVRLPRSLIDSGAVAVVEGDGTTSEALEAAGMEDADLFIAVSGRDTLNGLAAQKVRFYYRKERVICRVKDEDLRRVYESKGIETVNPTELVGDQILARITDFTTQGGE